MHSAASDPGSSSTVVRIRHSVLAPGTGSGAGDSVWSVGGAFSWRRVRQARSAVVNRRIVVAGRQLFFSCVAPVIFRVMHPL
ncbi:hypothetical protein GCM10010303_32050 [Streptomyces purpurascens]|nr:hypothetical protein GCM10010303_32050 [Streptomyces purpurascens]